MHIMEDKGKCPLVNNSSEKESTAEKCVSHELAKGHPFSNWEIAANASKVRGPAVYRETCMRTNGKLQACLGTSMWPFSGGVPHTSSELFGHLLQSSSAPWKNAESNKTGSSENRGLKSAQKVVLECSVFNGRKTSVFLCKISPLRRQSKPAERSRSFVILV